MVAMQNFQAISVSYIHLVAPGDHVWCYIARIWRNIKRCGSHGNCKLSKKYVVVSIYVNQGSGCEARNRVVHLRWCVCVTLTSPLHLWDVDHRAVTGYLTTSFCHDIINWPNNGLYMRCSVHYKKGLIWEIYILDMINNRHIQALIHIIIF